MNTALLATVLLLTAPLAFAQSKTKEELKQEVVSTLQDIRVEVNWDIATETQLTNTLGHLKSALAALQGNGTPESFPMRCVSRDNDGLSPYQIARVNDDFTTSTKIDGTSFGSLEACQTSIGKARSVRDFLILCTSRDNDGLSPYQAAAVPDEGTAAVKLTTYNSLETCYASLQRALFNATAVGMCGSRDHDGLFPYAFWSFNARTGEFKKVGEDFSSLEACYNR
jgi:hypothetical protein